MTNTNSPTGSRMILLLIGGIPVTMVLAATWLWFFVARGDLDLVGTLGTANRGALVQPPRQLNDHDVRAGSGEPFAMANTESRWAIIIPSPGNRCDATCEQRLYETRQIHLAMGKEFNRLHRVYISDHSAASTELTAQTLSDGKPAPGAGNFAAFLASEHADLQAVTVSAESFASLFPELEADSGTWYLADPAGWVMMSYNKSVSYKDVISDLKFLLKNSGG
jgi:hypothetical protein